jgi:dihydrofolate synthase/folylpolyglutamate synthase
VNILGENLAEIAGQKVGIVQPGNTVFTYRQAPEIMQVITDKCAEQDADLHIIEYSQQDANGLPDFQARNWQLARQISEYLQQRDNLPALSEDSLLRSRQIVIPGRMDVRQVEGKTLIMDGAHNLQKMTAFLTSFKKLHPGVKPAVLVSFKEGKEYRELAPILAVLADDIIITTFSATQDIPSHSMDPEPLAEAFREAGKTPRIITDQHEAFRALLDAPESIAVITGSFYLLHQIRNNENLT